MTNYFGKDYYYIMNYMIEIYVKDVRMEKGLSINELAKKAGISKSVISKVERKEVIPSLITVCKLSKALDVKLEKLINM